MKLKGKFEEIEPVEQEWLMNQQRIRFAAPMIYLAPYISWELYREQKRVVIDKWGRRDEA